MIARSCRTSPAVWLLLFLSGFLYYQFTKDDGSLDHLTGARPGVPPLQPVQSVQPVEPVKSEPQKPRIAVVTFITDQKSYLHLSLKNKDRECTQPLEGRERF
jgi:mannan polymerase II complex MNN10 subunit